DVEDFLAYDEKSILSDKKQKSVTNTYSCDNDVDIQVGTIHSVKGETHDATLILETKYSRWFDLEDMLDYLISDNITRPIEDYSRPKTRASIQAGFLRKLYVAASRPRHLLCMAISANHVTAEQINGLRDKGWGIKSLEV
ncbi:MAG: hypothetical protein DRI56_04580, partial [Chloroflexota bacterium]